MTAINRPQDAAMPDSPCRMHSDIKGTPYLEFAATSLTINDRKTIPPDDSLAKALIGADDFAKAYVAGGYGYMGGPAGNRLTPLRFPYSDGAVDGLKVTIARLEETCDVVRHEFAGAVEWIFMAREDADLTPAMSLAIALEWDTQRVKPLSASLACPQHGLVPGPGRPGRPKSFEEAARALGDEAITAAHEPMAEGTWKGASRHDVERALTLAALEDEDMSRQIARTGIAECRIMSAGPGAPCLVAVKSATMAIERDHPRIGAIAARFNYEGLLAVQKEKAPRAVWTRLSSYDVEGDFVCEALMKPLESATMMAARAATILSEEGRAATTAALDAFLEAHPPL